MTTTSAPRSLTLQMLEWLASRERTCVETMDAWRTSCPRLSIWEDALADDLVVVVRTSGGRGLGGSVVELTKEGRTLLGHIVPAPRLGG